MNHTFAAVVFGLASASSSRCEVRVIEPSAGFEHSYARALARDGLTVVGFYERRDTYEIEPFRWNAEAGFLTIQQPPTGSFALLSGVGGGSSRVVGLLGYSDGSGSLASWSPASGWQFEGYPQFTQGAFGYFGGISESGLVMAGTTGFGFTMGGLLPFGGDLIFDQAWRIRDGVVEALDGHVLGEPTGVYDVSADGAFLVGRSGQKAVRWDSNGESIRLELPGQDWRQSTAVAVSADGSIAAGSTYTWEGFPRAFVWRDGIGFREFEPPPGFRACFGESVSADGGVIVGSAYEEWGFVCCGRLQGGNRLAAMVVTLQAGVQTLESLLAATGSSLGGLIRLECALDVSDDGRIVTGVGVNAQGQYRGFVAELPPLTCRGDFNFDGSVNISDLVRILSAFGSAAQTGLGADLNSDGAVNVQDLTVFLGRFGSSCQPGQSVSLPG